MPLPPMNDTEIQIRIAESIAGIPAAAWNICAAGTVADANKIGDEIKLTHEDNSSPKLSTRGQCSNPFISHDFLSSLEESASVGGRTGWQPRHLLAENRDGDLLGVAPCYVKSHS